MRRGVTAGSAVVAAVWFAGAASASGLLTDVNVRRPTIKMNRAGIALVEYSREDGRRRHWEGAGLGRYDPAVDSRPNLIFDRVMARDRICSRER